jgi:UDP-4-amino-4,6-dideoxy-N-acetyl-beta-L-altrosamine transaminase
MIPYSRQTINEADIKAVIDVLRSPMITQGPMIERFEQAVADYCGAKYAVAVNSGTSALHLACLALGLGPGDQLWTSPNSFVASANCALYCRARVDFVDIHPQSYNMDINALESKLRGAAITGNLPKIVLPVHFAGRPCDMVGLASLAEEYGFSVIEDAAHALGAMSLGERVGGCRHSAMTVFSFHPVKPITTGEGGVITTDDDNLYRRLRRLRSHGIIRNPDEMVDLPDGPWSYEQIELGYNYRMTDIQAALGASQLNRLDQFIKDRGRIASEYHRRLNHLPLQLPLSDNDDIVSGWHLYPIQVKSSSDAQQRRTELFRQLRKKGLGINVHYRPIHTQPYYRKMGFNWGDFPKAEAYYHRALSLPLFPGLTEAQLTSMVNAINKGINP